MNPSHTCDEEVLKSMTALRALGVWSAKMYLIFILDRPNMLLFKDDAFLQAYKLLYTTVGLKSVSIKERRAPWSPYSSSEVR